jgi:hypothetical protein
MLHQSGALVTIMDDEPEIWNNETCKPYELKKVELSF